MVEQCTARVNLVRESVNNATLIGVKLSQVGLPQKVIPDEGGMLIESCVSDQWRACYSIEGVHSFFDSIPTATTIFPRHTNRNRRFG